MCSCAQIPGVYNSYDRVFPFPLDRQALDQRSARPSASVASYAVGRWGLAVGDGRWTDIRSDGKSNRNSIHCWADTSWPSRKNSTQFVVSVEHASQSGASNFVVAVKFLENVCNPGYANLWTLLSHSVALWIS